MPSPPTTQISDGSAPQMPLAAKSKTGIQAKPSHCTTWLSPAAKMLLSAKPKTAWSWLPADGGGSKRTHWVVVVPPPEVTPPPLPGANFGGGGKTKLAGGRNQISPLTPSGEPTVTARPVPASVQTLESSPFGEVPGSDSSAHVDGVLSLGVCRRKRCSPPTPVPLPKPHA